MLIEHSAPRCLVLDYEVEVFQKTAIAATHVADALRLLAKRAIKDLGNDLIHFLEISLVRATAAPYIHPSVDQEFDTGLVQARNAGIAKQEGVHDSEGGQI